MRVPDLYEEMRLIKRHFSFLFEQGARVLSSSQDARAFGNIIVELETPDLRVQFIRDRGEIILALETLRSDPAPDSPDWCDLIGIVWYLTQKRLLIASYLDNRMDDEKQLEQLAKVFHHFYDQLVALFQVDTYNQNKEGILLLFRDLQQLFIDRHLKDEKQKLLNQSAPFWEQLNSV